MNQIKSIVWALLAFAACALNACTTFRSLPPDQILNLADEELKPWRDRWWPTGKAAEGEDGDKAAASLHKLKYLEENYAEELDRERLSYLLGEAYFANAEWSRAYRQMSSHLENYSFTKHRTDIEKIIFQVALQWREATGFSFRSIFISNRSRAMDALNYLIDNAPHSTYTDKALRLIAEMQFQDREYNDAIATYERILQGYPNSVWCDLAQYQIGLAYLKRVNDHRMDRDGLIQAEARLREYLERRKEGSFRKDAEEAHKKAVEMLAESEMAIGAFYERIDKPAGAREHYRAVVKNYPESTFAAAAAKKIGELDSEKTAADQTDSQ